MKKVRRTMTEEFMEKEITEQLAEEPKEEQKEEPKEEPVKEQVSKKIEPPKVTVLMMEEFLRGYSNYKPQHLQSVLAFCKSRGFPVKGTEAELTQILKEFGWGANLRKQARR